MSKYLPTDDNGYRVDTNVFSGPTNRVTLGNFIASLTDGDFAVQRATNNGQMLVELSMGPLVEDKESSLEYNGTIKAPFTLDVPLSISQRARNAYFQLEAIQKVSTSLVSTVGTVRNVSSYSQSGTLITIVLETPTDIQRGQWFDIYGIDNSLANISNANVASVSADRKTITCSYTDDMLVTSQTITAILSMGFFRRQALGIKEPNGSGYKFTKNSSSVANLMSRSLGGNVRNGTSVSTDQVISVGISSPIMLNGGNGQFEIRPTTTYELVLEKNSVAFLDYGVDSTASQSTARLLQEMSIPEYYAEYTPRLRAVSPKSMSRPIAKIISVSKTGTTTATVTTDVPHGLIAGKSIVDVHGMRDATNFIAAGQMTVLTTPTTTTFTVAFGTAVTATTYGGMVSIVNGGVQMTGRATQSIQSLSIDADGIMSVVGSAAWGTVVVGEYVNLHGVRADLTGADLGFDGVYELIDLTTTVLKLRAVKNPDGTIVKNGAGLNVTPVLPVTASVNCGGAVIMRTTAHIHDLRMEERSYNAVKILGQGESRADLALPITVQNTPIVQLGGTTYRVADGATPYKLIGAATTNSTLIIAGTKNLMTINISNDTVAKVYVKMYNKATAPVVGTDIPVEVYMVPANSFRDINIGYYYGAYYSLGIGFATTGLQVDTDTTAVLAGVTVTVRYK